MEVFGLIPCTILKFSEIWNDFNQVLRRLYFEFDIEFSFIFEMYSSMFILYKNKKYKNRVRID